MVNYFRLGIQEGVFKNMTFGLKSETCEYVVVWGDQEVKFYTANCENNVRCMWWGEEDRRRWGNQAYLKILEKTWRAGITQERRYKQKIRHLIVLSLLIKHLQTKRPRYRLSNLFSIKRKISIKLNKYVKSFK